MEWVQNNVKKTESVIIITGVILLSFLFIILSGSSLPTDGKLPVQSISKSDQTKPLAPQTKQTKPKAVQAGSKTSQAKSKSSATKSKSAQPVSKTGAAAKPAEAGTLRIGNQTWAVANLDVTKFRNGDSIPEAKSAEEWVKAGEAGKPAWCYYNNDRVIGKKFGKLYNWYAVNDPRGLAPMGWSVPGDEDWVALTNFLGGPGVAGNKLKSENGWTDNYNGTNETGFAGLPGGYRVENGKFMNLGSIATWWSTTESRSDIAIDHYLIQSGSFPRSNNSKLRGEYVRCIKK